ncbi:unnamed protein product [Microthlaspi erraticum]|uniref:Uncharacterized protein n=1 Tax=Microthlaspi erraticum TaxID=1685480 RepID=A0A6D2LLB1_9BRAS|nr:unnamed protein product [Microthlaspi erraticum]
MREIQPQFNPGGIEKQFGRSRTQLARVKRRYHITTTLSARIDEPSDNARPSPKRHDRNEGSSIRPTAMHRMADELKTSRRREHRWKLILWSPKNTKEEERKETIEQIRDGQRNHIPKPLARTTKDLRIHTFKSPQTSQGATKHKVGR